MDKNIQALPPDAIAQVVNAYRDAYDEREAVAGGVWEHQAAHDAGCAAFREALASVLPKDAPDDTVRGLVYRALELLADNKREYTTTNEATDWFLRERRIEALLLEIVGRQALPPPRYKA